MQMNLQDDDQEMANVQNDFNQNNYEVSQINQNPSQIQRELNYGQSENDKFQSGEQSYRMVSKEYFCFVCNKNKKKMVQVAEFRRAGLLCDTCGQGFCEILGDQNTKELGQFGAQNQSNQQQNQIGEKSMLNQLTDSADQVNIPPKVTNRVENIRNRNLASDSTGRPLEQRAQEEAKQQAQELPQPRPQRVRVVRSVNPYAGFGNFMEDFFEEERPERGRNDQQMESGGVFDEFFRPLNLTSMFNDDHFQQMSQMSSFDPHEFGINYNQNFRSTRPSRQGQRQRQQQQSQDPGLGLFQRVRQPQGPQISMSFDELVQRLAQQMQQAGQEGGHQNRPARPDVIHRLPLVTIEEKHCKKLDDGSLERPTCSVCITDFEIGTKSLFLPCGHQFHQDCIKPWLQDHNTCPVCRKELPS